MPLPISGVVARESEPGAFLVCGGTQVPVIPGRLPPFEGMLANDFHLELSEVPR